jgi:hypothetical protein
LQDPPKSSQIWIFGLKNKPSGNPGFNHKTSNRLHVSKWRLSMRSAPFFMSCFFQTIADLMRESFDWKLCFICSAIILTLFRSRACFDAGRPRRLLPYKVFLHETLISCRATSCDTMRNRATPYDIVRHRATSSDTVRHPPTPCDQS